MIAAYAALFVAAATINALLVFLVADLQTSEEHRDDGFSVAVPA